MLASRNITLSQMPSRERTSTIQASTASPGDRTNDSQSPRANRPGHVRSRSYLSGVTAPGEARPRNVGGLPDGGDVKDVGYDSSASSILPRLHLPVHRSRHANDVEGHPDGAQQSRREHRLHLPGRTHSYHRHTRSEAFQSKLVSDATSRTIDSGPDTSLLSARGGPGRVLTKVASNLSSRNLAQNAGRANHLYSTSDFQKSWLYNNSSGATHKRPDARRRATSDPRAPSYQGFQGQEPFNMRTGAETIQEPDGSKTEVAILLEKADKAKALEADPTHEEVNHLSMQLAEVNVELQDRLTDLSRVYATFQRRLDDASIQLSSTGSALVDTISSFENLNQQSQALTGNFEQRARELIADIAATLDKHRVTMFEERGTKITELERRSHRATVRAEEMSRRLETCRTVVRTYTERQQTKQRAWKGVLLGSLWGVSVIILGVTLGLGLWWAKKHGALDYDLGQAPQLLIRPLMKGTADVDAHKVVQKQLEQENSPADRQQVLQNVPEDVKQLLEAIAQRHNTSQRRMDSRPQRQMDIDTEEDGGEPLDKLFQELDT